MMNALETHRKVKALPALPTVLAKDMMFAQGWAPSDSELAAIRARADFYEALGLSREVHIRVGDVYNPKCKIGELIYRA